MQKRTLQTFIAAVGLPGVWLQPGASLSFILNGGNTSWFLFLIWHSCPLVLICVNLLSVDNIDMWELMCTWCEMERDSFSASSNKLLQHRRTQIKHMCRIFMCVWLHLCASCACVYYLGCNEVWSTCWVITSGLNIDSNSV